MHSVYNRLESKKQNALKIKKSMKKRKPSLIGNRKFNTKKKRKISANQLGGDINTRNIKNKTKKFKNSIESIKNTLSNFEKYYNLYEILH